MNLRCSVNEIIVNGGPQANFIDLNGIDSLQFRGLTRVLSEENNFIVEFSVEVNAGGGDDVIIGTSGSLTNTKMFGGLGNDMLRDSVTSTDELVGGPGDDTYIITSSDFEGDSDAIVEVSTPWI